MVKNSRRNFEGPPLANFLLWAGIIVSALIFLESWLELTKQPFSFVKLLNQAGLTPYKPAQSPSKGIWHVTGWVGSGCFAIMMLYSLRKRFKFMIDVGGIGHWLNLHMFLGVFGTVFVTVHSTYKFGGIVALSYWSAVLVVVSGFLGRYLYVRIPRTVEGNELRMDEIGSLMEELNAQIAKFSPVVRVRDGDNAIEFFRWGLVPFWAKDVKSAAKYSLINAKSEDIEKKRSYKEPFEKRRCVVPLSGFYEWMRTGKTKRPFVIRLKDEPIISVAGVWEKWHSKDSGEEIFSFSIVTTGADKALSGIHDRMPVILGRNDEQKWLDPENRDLDGLKKLLRPCPPEWLTLYEVSPLVNSVKVNKKELLAPLKNGPGFKEGAPG